MRLLLEGIRVAFSALVTNKLRTFLTLLGNIVGIMAVIAVVSLLRGIDNYARQTVASEGSNIITIERINFLQAVTDYEEFLNSLKYNPALTEDDVAGLREKLTVPRHVSGQVTSTATVKFATKYLTDIEIKGTDERYPFIDNIRLYAGRHLSRLEVTTNAPVAVIGWDVYTSLIKPRDPLGKSIRIGTRHFKIIGVTEDMGSVLGQSRNRFCIIPLGAFPKVFGGNRSIRVKLKAADIAQIPEAVEEARFFMRARHGLRPNEKDDFFVSTSEQLIEIWQKMSGGIMLALLALVSISMIVGGIVLMNTMLVSVTERTREVGIRKALGARRRDIVWQFLVESATLSVIGGLIGMLIGFSIAVLIAWLTPIPYSSDPVIVAIALAVTIAIGLIFGTYPAIKAAMQDPVVALRYE
jgi:putative ABC transport system permease protein